MITTALAPAAREMIFNAAGRLTDAPMKARAPQLRRLATLLVGTASLVAGIGTLTVLGVWFSSFWWGERVGWSHLVLGRVWYTEVDEVMWGRGHIFIGAQPCQLWEDSTPSKDEFLKEAYPVLGFCRERVSTDAAVGSTVNDGSLANTLGFFFVSDDVVCRGTGKVTGIVLPCWALVAVLAPLPTAAFLRWRTRRCARLRAELGQCRVCGYDLRGCFARCPECGSPFPPRKPRGSGVGG